VDALPGDLLARLRERAGSPTRNDADHGAHVGTYDDWFDAVAVMEEASPGSATAFAMGAQNARANGGRCNQCTSSGTPTAGSA
jgi:hypothetical protein